MMHDYQRVWKCKGTDYKDNMCNTHYKKEERKEIGKLLCTKENILVYLYDINDKFNCTQKIDNLLTKSEHTIKYYETHIYKGMFVMKKEKLETIEKDKIFQIMFMLSNSIINKFNEKSEKYKIKSLWKYSGDKNDDSEYFFVILYK